MDENVLQLKNQATIMDKFFAEFQDKFGHPPEIYAVVRMIEHQIADKEATYASSQFSGRSHKDLVALRAVARSRWKEQALLQFQDMLDNLRIGGADKLIGQMREEDLITMDEMRELHAKVTTKEEELRTKQKEQEAKLQSGDFVPEKGETPSETVPPKTRKKPGVKKKNAQVTNQ